MLRLRTWLHQLLIAIDQLFHVLLGAPGYLVTGNDCPNADETISSVVGRYAENGWKWALVAEAVINPLMFVLTGQKNHCRSSIGH